MGELHWALATESWCIDLINALSAIFLLSTFQVMGEPSSSWVAHWRPLYKEITIILLYFSAWAILPLWLSGRRCHDPLITIFLNVISENYKRSNRVWKARIVLWSSYANCQPSSLKRLGLGDFAKCVLLSPLARTVVILGRLSLRTRDTLVPKKKKKKKKKLATVPSIAFVSLQQSKINNSLW